MKGLVLTLCLDQRPPRTGFVFLKMQFLCHQIRSTLRSTLLSAVRFLSTHDSENRETTHLHRKLDTRPLVNLIRDAEHEQSKVGHHADLQQGTQDTHMTGHQDASDTQLSVPHWRHLARDFCFSQLVRHNFKDAFSLFLLENVFVCPCVGVCT